MMRGRVISPAGDGNGTTAPATASTARGTPGPDMGETIFANFADPQYDAAVADLQKALQNGRGRLDPRTIEIVEKNLAVIDQAIDQARQALRADPANAYLNSYVADARRRKLALLREATAGMTREQTMARPVAGKWSTLEVVCHIADFEIVGADRIKRVMVPGPEFRARAKRATMMAGQAIRHRVTRGAAIWPRLWATPPR
jgi:hypothetical protein